MQIQIILDTQLYKKNPMTSELGKRILSGSIEMIDQLGFENFTFKKLSDYIHSPESSVYRYFTNKHQLLLYLSNWYWAWLNFKLDSATKNIETAKDKLNKIIEILAGKIQKDNRFAFINEVLLEKIIISESVKIFHTKNVDKENRQGFFKEYIDLIENIAQIIQQVSPNYKYPKNLANTLVKSAHLQRFFSEHIPEVTDKTKNQNTTELFFKELIFKTLN